MAKIFLAGESTPSTVAVTKELKKKFDSSFFNKIGENLIIKVQEENPVLFLVFINNLSEENKKGLMYLLSHTANLPFILIGSKEEIKTYFGTSKALILNYVHTPVTVSSLISITAKEYEKLTGEKILFETENSEETKPEVKTAAGRLKKVLVVDDDAVFLRTMMNWLKNDFEVSVVKSGAACISFLGKSIPDLILLDYEMPLMNGPQTLEILRSEENFKDIPVMFLTGVSDTAKVVEAVKLKPQGYILKTATQAQIIEKVKQLLFGC